MLSINLEFIKGILLIRLEGILTEKTNSILVDKIDEMLYEKGIKNIIINLEELEYVNESGLNSLLEKYYDTILHDGKLVICEYGNLNKLVFDVFSKNNILTSNNELSALKMISI